jgi:hypothetical protein
MRRLAIGLLTKSIGRGASTPGIAHPLFEKLKEEGVIRLNEALSDCQCADIAAYLSDKPVHDRFVSIDRAFSEAQPDDMSFGIHLRENVLDCPHVMEFVCSPKIVRIAEDYLGCTPTLTCLGVQWSFPTKVPGVAQKFHRDSEDWKYLRFIIYLTDVEQGGGPHVYIQGTHREKTPLRLKFYSNEEISHQYSADRVVKMFGKRGTGIVADTCGIHKGELPTSSPRLVLTFTFAILPNPLETYTPCITRHASIMTNYTTRLFLR